MRTFADLSFDAFLLNGFATCDDLKCALMGVRQASDLPVFASVDVADDGTLSSGRGTLDEAVAVMDEYGATVAGFETRADAEVAAGLVRRMAQRRATCPCSCSWRWPNTIPSRASLQPRIPITVPTSWCRPPRA